LIFSEEKNYSDAGYPASYIGQRPLKINVAHILCYLTVLYESIS